MKSFVDFSKLYGVFAKLILVVHYTSKIQESVYLGNNLMYVRLTNVNITYHEYHSRVLSKINKSMENIIYNILGMKII